MTPPPFPKAPQSWKCKCPEYNNHSLGYEKCRECGATPPKAASCERCGDALGPSREVDSEGKTCSWEACECDVGIPNAPKSACRDCSGNGCKYCELGHTQLSPSADPKATSQEDQVPTDTIIKCLYILADDIQSDDGVAQEAIRQAARRMESLSSELERVRRENERMAKALKEIAPEYHWKPCCSCGAEIESVSSYFVCSNCRKPCMHQTELNKDVYRIASIAEIALRPPSSPNL